MSVHELAGKPAPRQMLVNVPHLITAYYTHRPDPDDPAQRVSFGTSGHRGTSLECSFNEAHVLAICQAICELRVQRGIHGPLYLGMDTHALSEPAHASAIEVFAGNGVDVMIQEGMGYTPTPAVSRAILAHNRGQASGQADGVVISPSHNPPADGGIKYNPPSGGPADTETTGLIQDRANQLLSTNLRGVKRIPLQRALHVQTTHRYDFVRPYVEDLQDIIDMDCIARAQLKIAVDPLGGSSVNYWEPVAARYKLDLQVVNHTIDPTFSFMTVDHDGKIRIDCSSPYAMVNLVSLKDGFDIAFGTDPDADRHGIVAPSTGLMNPNHYLAVAIWYLFRNRPTWRHGVGVGKTLVSSSMIDRVAAYLGRTLVEVPVGFKWFVDGLARGSLGFGGEESAGASFLRGGGTAWTTDKDGLILGLLAAEITAATGRDPAEHYEDLQERFGSPVYERADVPATAEERAVLKNLSPDRVQAKELAGEAIVAKLTRAPGNNEPIGGLKVVTENGWFAVRPSGTENLYKIYAESFKGPEHLRQLQVEAREIVAAALKSE